MGQTITPASLMMMADDLGVFDPVKVMNALSKVRLECKRFTLADVVERINAQDGRLSADEAWATALLAHDESETVVWTEEAAQAYWASESLLQNFDKIGARMAFKGAYERLCLESRNLKKPVKWLSSLGHDPEKRKFAIEQAVHLNRLTESAAAGLLPAPKVDPNNPILKLIDGNVTTPDVARARLAQLKKMLA